MQGFWAEPAVPADGAGMTSFRELKSSQPAPLLNFIVRPRKARGWVMGWFDFLKRKPEPATPADGPYTPEDFPCPDPTPGGARHNGAYSGWLDPTPVGVEIAFAVVVPK